MSIDGKVGMTQEEVDALPVIESQEGEYEHIKEHYTCPKCETPLETAKSELLTFGKGVFDSDPEPTNATRVYAAGCPECGILYRFDDEPIIR